MIIFQIQEGYKAFATKKNPVKLFHKIGKSIMIDKFMWKDICVNCELAQSSWLIAHFQCIIISMSDRKSWKLFCTLVCRWAKILYMIHYMHSMPLISIHFYISWLLPAFWDVCILLCYRGFCSRGQPHTLFVVATKCKQSDSL